MMYVDVCMYVCLCLYVCMLIETHSECYHIKTQKSGDQERTENIFVTEVNKHVLSLSSEEREVHIVKKYEMWWLVKAEK